MEILQTLRNHIENDKTSSITNIDAFLTLLENTEKQLKLLLECVNNELNEDKYIARCIDLEGFDGCGKSTLADELHRQLTSHGQKSCLLSTPPNQLLPFRSYFDKQSELIRRAFYNFGNLMVSFELKTQPDVITILDRYWPSTIAYQSAKMTTDDPINISWPKYLVQPALIIYIYVDEQERCRRVALRSIPITLEEKQLAAQEVFRRRLDFIYRNHIPSSNLHIMNGNEPTHVVANHVLSLLQE